MKTISKIFSTAAIAALTITTSFAQTNLGAECGCPVVSGRTSINMSTFADANGELTSNQTLTCNNTYVLDNYTPPHTCRQYNSYPQFIKFSLICMGLDTDFNKNIIKPVEIKKNLLYIN